MQREGASHVQGRSGQLQGQPYACGSALRLLQQHAFKNETAQWASNWTGRAQCGEPVFPFQRTARALAWLTHQWRIAGLILKYTAWGIPTGYLFYPHLDGTSIADVYAP